MRKRLRDRVVLSLLLAWSWCSVSMGQFHYDSGGPAFDVVTIKPTDPNGRRTIGYYCYPDGRLWVPGATVTLLAQYAFDIPDDLVVGGPPWASHDRYDVEALPPDGYTKTNVGPKGSSCYVPTPAQTSMLQAMLADRFHLKYHWIAKSKPVYLLVRGTGALQLEEAKDKNGPSGGGVFRKVSGIADGEAAGRNMSMQQLAREIGQELDRPVIDQTGLTKTYDFHLAPEDATNTDMTLAIFRAMKQLGLELKRGEAPVNMLVIDAVERPSPN